MATQASVCMRVHPDSSKDFGAIQAIYLLTYLQFTLCIGAKVSIPSLSPEGRVWMLSAEIWYIGQRLTGSVDERAAAQNDMLAAVTRRTQQMC